MCSLCPRKLLRLAVLLLVPMSRKLHFNLQSRNGDSEKKELSEVENTENQSAKYLIYVKWSIPIPIGNALRCFACLQKYSCTTIEHFYTLHIIFDRISRLCSTLWMQR